LFDELSDTIGIGQRQSERAERYIRSADEVPFFNASGKQELCRLKHADFRRIFRVVITREDLGWVGARIAILSMLDPGMSTSFPWHVSLDDLRIVAELFKDSELRFVHFLEERLKASEQIALSQHDEIQHKRALRQSSSLLRPTNFESRSDDISCGLHARHRFIFCQNI
jgi:hypothetical protein